jgi:hypothetical protein
MGTMRTMGIDFAITLQVVGAGGAWWPGDARYAGPR